jgi:inosine-uridine preferring nucleoside hydrolase
MGGSYTRGNVTPAAEFNIFVDPEAAAVVFEAGWPLTMVGLDVTQRALAGEQVLQRIARLGNTGLGRGRGSAALLRGAPIPGERQPGATCPRPLRRGEGGQTGAARTASSSGRNPARGAADDGHDGHRVPPLTGPTRQRVRSHRAGRGRFLGPVHRSGRTAVETPSPQGGGGSVTSRPASAGGCRPRLAGRLYG